MQLNALTAISPVDGRYRSRTAHLAPFFSEWGLMRYRVRVEVEYFLHLSEIPLPQLAPFKADDAEPLRRIYTEFSEADAERIKAFERTTNHDVKAVEYFIKEKMEALGLAEMAEFIHFGLTSQDVNNTAIPLSIKEATEQVIVPGAAGFAEDPVAASA